MWRGREQRIAREVADNVQKVRPKFERPPLIEQAITVIFDELSDFSLGDFGLYWAQIRDAFPHSEAQPLIESRIEDFGEFRPREMTFRIIPAETLPRCTYRSEDGSELVQVQQDRFTFNWSGSPDRAYPHSEATVARFAELFRGFLAYLERRAIATPAIRQCEIINVNIVPVADIGGTYADAPAFFNIPTADVLADFLPAESYAVNTQRRILREGEPIGRLYSALSPVIRSDDGVQAYRLEITARGAPLGTTLEGVLAFFDIARSAINAAFMAATTPAARLFWREIDGNSSAG